MRETTPVPRDSAAPQAFGSSLLSHRHGGPLCLEAMKPHPNEEKDDSASPLEFHAVMMNRELGSVLLRTMFQFLGFKEYPSIRTPCAEAQKGAAKRGAGQELRGEALPLDPGATPRHEGSQMMNGQPGRRHLPKLKCYQAQFFR